MSMIKYNYKTKTLLSLLMSIAMIFSSIGVLPQAVQATINPGPVPVSNPQLSQACGLDISLVLDSSGSISSSNMIVMQNAFKDFVDSFLPATPTMFSVIDFDDVAHTPPLDFTSNVSLIDSAINTTVNGGYTNWQDGLAKAFGLSDPRPISTHPNLIIFASDGQPNRYNNPPQGSGTTIDLAALAAAITQANTIKSAGTRIITLGIGVTGSNADNLKAISSSDAYYDVSSFATLVTSLQALATQFCGGTITAHKVLDADGNLETTGDQTPGADWSFNVAGTSTTTDQSGNTIAVEVDPGSYSVGETQQDGYSLISADCTGATNNGSLDGSTIYGIQVGSQDIVSCTFYNSLLPTLTVVKTVVNNGTDTSLRLEPNNFQIRVKQGDSEVAGSPAVGSSTGTTYALTPGEYVVSEDSVEDYTGDFSGCGESGSVNLSYGDQVTCSIVNTENPPELPTTGTLVVTKTVVNDNGGTKSASDFSITVEKDQVSITNPSPVTAENSATYTYTDLTPGPYYVYENEDNGYVADLSQCGDHNVNIVAGETTVCTITNDDKQGTLVVKKLIIGNDVSATNFSFSVNDGQLVSFEQDGQNDLLVNAGVYTVAEAAVSNYTASYEGCAEVSVANGGESICVITNTYNRPAELGSIHGYKWNDLDENGNSIGEEPLLSGWTIFIDENDNGLLDGEEISTQTSDSTEHYGWYWFNDLPMGTYSICEVHQSGWVQTYPESGCHQVTLPEGNPQSFPITLNAVIGPEYNFGNHYVGQELEDACSNLEGMQTQVPSGYDLVDGRCIQQSSGGGGGGSSFSCTTANSPDSSNSAAVADVSGSIITLNLAYTSDVTNVILSTDVNFATQWSIAVAPQVTWQLPVGFTTGTIYVKFVNKLGCGSVVQNLSATAGPQSKVLGVTTCEALINKYIKYGAKNDPIEVKKLQQFLNDYLGLKLPITGYYGLLTRAAVRQFQLKYNNEVLAPWVPHGLPNNETATGYVYKTTKRWINMTYCPALNLPTPQLP